MDPKEPKKSKKGCWIAAIIVALFLIILAIIAVKLWLAAEDAGNNNVASIIEHEVNKNSSTSQTSTSGKWTLTMSSPFSIAGLDTNLSGEGKASINLDIPSGGTVSASGPWSSEGHGSVGPSTENTTLSGTISFDGTVQNGKLTFKPAFSEANCRTEIVTPIGSQVTTNCDPNSIPDQKTITINITDGATATADVATNYGNYSYNWKENWVLNKK